MTVAGGPLVCPSCAEPHPLSERFCRSCGMPLVYPGSVGVDAPVTPRQERARKIKPQYADGDLVRVTGAFNQTEGEFIQNLLLEEGVPSMLRRARGFDVPDMLAAGPRDVMVPRSGYEAAREVLLEADLANEDAVDPHPSPQRLMAGLLAGLGVVALVIWIGTLIAGS